MEKGLDASLRMTAEKVEKPKEKINKNKPEEISKQKKVTFGKPKETFEK